MFRFRAAAIFFSRDFRLGFPDGVVYTRTTSCVDRQLGPDSTFWARVPVPSSAACYTDAHN